MIARDFLKKISVLAVIAILASGATLLVDDAYEQDCNPALKLVTPDIRCNKTYVIDKAEYTALKARIVNYLNAEKAAGDIARAGVYFRDLDNGPTMGINDTDKFVPASLLKTPLMVTYLNMADDKPGVLNEKLGFSWTEEPQLTQYYKPSQTIEPGKSYTVDELLHHMIAYSDNASYYVLLQHLRDIDPGGSLFFGTFQDLGIIDPASNLDQSISTKSYASIFRALYNGSYLSKTSSERALEYLAQSDFDGGIRAGVPAGTTIAHKFGERFGITAADMKELHDCGVVYYPGNPYLLCIMTEGPQYPALAKVIAAISKMTWAEVDSRRL